MLNRGTMATPSKQNIGTPTHPASSPRPSGGPVTRPPSHKSPLTTMPSVSYQQPSLQGNILHQYSTPFAAMAGIDDPVVFSSPSALLALGGYTGITPSPAGNDGLVSHVMNEGDIQALGIQGLKLGTPRDSDEERKRHIEEVVRLLRTCVVGRGVCREGVERLAQLEGFESIWQEDNLNVAGNLVDLEIEFYPSKNTVRGVSLRYAAPEAAGSERREEASAVLKHDLVQLPEDGDRGNWKPLDGFYQNLRWLAKLDRLSQEVNCFEAIEGLYECLKRIWDREEEDPELSDVYNHLCSGRIGRPRMHKRGRIGLSMDYWIPQARVLDAKWRRSTSDDMMTDQVSPQLYDEELERRLKLWSMLIECEEGYPSLRVSREWVGSKVLTNTGPGQETPNAPAEPSAVTVNWADPPPSVNGRDVDAMDIDTDILASSPLNRRFTAVIEPPLDVPTLTASDIYRHVGIPLPHELKMATYDWLLAPGWCAPVTEAGGGHDRPFQPGRRKQKMSVDTFDLEGKLCRKRHSYTFQPFESVAGRTLRDIPFSHPRQLVDIIPILRQYAVLASMIRTLFPPSAEGKNMEDSTPETKNPTDAGRFPYFSTSGVSRKSNGVIILSNEDPKEARLNFLLDDVQARGPDCETTATDDVSVDVTLRTPFGQAPLIMLLFTARDISPTGEPELESMSISFEIGLNGRIAVVETAGLDGSSESQNNQDNRTLELRKKMADVLETSQDIGILIEWALRWKRQRHA